MIVLIHLYYKLTQLGYGLLEDLGHRKVQLLVHLIFVMLGTFVQVMAPNQRVSQGLTLLVLDCHLKLSVSRAHLANTLKLQE